MHTNVILTNKRRTHAQSNYTNTKLKAWFRRLLRHPARKRSGSILRQHTPGPTDEDVTARLSQLAITTQSITESRQSVMHTSTQDCPSPGRSLHVHVPPARRLCQTMKTATNRSNITQYYSQTHQNKNTFQAHDSRTNRLHFRTSFRCHYVKPTEYVACICF